jgi:hypothetical protein
VPAGFPLALSGYGSIVAEPLILVNNNKYLLYIIFLYFNFSPSYMYYKYNY